jgi:hypothetical protein
MSIRKILSDTEMVKNTIYNSLSKKLKEYEGEISDYDLREIIFSMFERILGYTIEWADIDEYGKNRILVHIGEEKAIINISSLMESLKMIHKDYIAEEQSDPKLISLVTRKRRNRNRP